MHQQKQLKKQPIKQRKMYKLTLKKGEIIHVNTKGITITLEGDKEYDQVILQQLHENGVKNITKSKESAK